MPELNTSLLMKQTAPTLLAAAATTIGAESLDSATSSPWRKWGDSGVIITEEQREVAIKAAEGLFYSSPLAHYIIEQYTDYVVGEGGFELTSSNREARKALYEFWHSPLNAIPRNLYSQVMEYFVYGELCYLKKDHSDGFVSLTFVPPRFIDSVTEKEGVPGRPAKVILKSENDGEEGRGYTVIDWDTKKGALVGECFYFRMQHLGSDVRGYSRLLPLIDFLRAWEAFTYNYLGKRANWDAIWWEVTLAGYTSEQIDDWLQKNRTPPAAGSMFAHNELVEYNLVQPDFRASGVQDDGTWYHDFLIETSGLGKGPSKSGAKQREVSEVLDPVTRGLSTRQWDVRTCYAHIGAYVLQQAIVCGGLPDEPYDVICQAPRLGVRDFQRSAASLLRFVDALGQAEDRDWITWAANREIFQDMLSRLGMVEKVRPLRIDDEEEGGEKRPNSRPGGSYGGDYGDGSRDERGEKKGDDEDDSRVRN